MPGLFSASGPEMFEFRHTSGETRFVFQVLLVAASSLYFILGPQLMHLMPRHPLASAECRPCEAL